MYRVFESHTRLAETTLSNFQREIHGTLMRQVLH